MANGVMRADGLVNANLALRPINASSGFLSSMSSAFSAASRFFSSLFIRPAYSFFSALGNAFNCCRCCCKEPLPVVYRGGQPQAVYVPPQPQVVVLPGQAPGLQAAFGARPNLPVVAAGPNILQNGGFRVGGPMLGGGGPALPVHAAQLPGHHPGPGGAGLQAGFGGRPDAGGPPIGAPFVGGAPHIGPGIVNAPQLPGHHPGPGGAGIQAAVGARQDAPRLPIGARPPGAGVMHAAPVPVLRGPPLAGPGVQAGFGGRP